MIDPLEQKAREWLRRWLLPNGRMVWERSDQEKSLTALLREVAAEARNDAGSAMLEVVRAAKAWKHRHDGMTTISLPESYPGQGEDDALRAAVERMESDKKED